jgi:hypothetical protein
MDGGEEEACEFDKRGTDGVLYSWFTLAIIDLEGHSPTRLCPVGEFILTSLSSVLTVASSSKPNFNVWNDSLPIPRFS